jgi:hypothetical protein
VAPVMRESWLAPKCQMKMKLNIQEQDRNRQHR